MCLPSEAQRIFLMTSKAEIYLFDGGFNYDNALLQSIQVRQPHNYAGNLILCYTGRRAQHLERLFIERYVGNHQTVIPPVFTTMYQYLARFCPRKLVSEIESKYIMLQALHRISDSMPHVKMPELVDEILELYQNIRYFYPDKSLNEAMTLVKNKIAKGCADGYLSKLIFGRVETVSAIILEYSKILHDNSIIGVAELVHDVVINESIEVAIIDLVLELYPVDYKIIASLLQNTIKALLFAEKQHGTSFMYKFDALYSGMNWNIKDVSESANEGNVINHQVVFIPAERRENELVSLLPTKENEIRFIAQRIKEAVMKGTPVDEISIIFPEPYKYISSIKRIFSNYAIEFSYSFGERMLNEPSIQSAYSVLNLVAEDFPRDILLFVVGSNYFSIKDRMKISAEIKQSKVIYGAASWDKEASEVSKFISKIKKLEGCTALNEFISAYITLLRLLNYGSVTGLSERDCSVIEEFWDLLISLHSLTIGIKATFNEFKRIIGYLLTQKRYFGKEKIAKGVKVMGIIESMGIPSTIIFFGGLIDGDEPKIKDWLLIPDEVRKTIGIPATEDNVREQKFYFNRVVQSGSKLLYLSFPQLEANKKTLHSFFLADYCHHHSWDRIKPEVNAVFSLEDHLINKGECIDWYLKNYFKTASLNDSNIELINTYYDSEHLGITDIMKYYECPRAFYFEKILGLEEYEEPTFDYDAKEWGILVHKVLKEAFENGENWQKKAMELFSEHVKVFPVPIQEFFSKRFKMDLIFLKQFQDNIEDEYDIRERELRVAGELAIEDKKQNIKGIIDRIDIKKDGSNYLLIDYKTGNVDDKKYSLQLSLYAWLYRMKENILPAQMILLSLAGLRSKEKKLIPRKKQAEDIIEEMVNEARSVILNIRKGLFFNTGEDEEEAGEMGGWHCSYCAFKNLCW
ncbi:MAG: hypothetical protein A2Y62_03370 [Candidatus Fischerbacteria bacterium RBG_13_37_8]|uniref:PD-(D/E)XK endonuclease-like domain-containing protein n=1 Tax=Candidatus Fischerbacteria bacterium RBG_13_37_8 TaxID=1817863 RepID=A0A1F5VJX6_9BACT|nr:MAG: hypothetical protein A2Y62_03370 [Candidatus Fischerbacteria bacterium RBG_13_37_8]